MHSRVRERVSRRLIVGVVSILLPSLVLGYVGVQTLAERSSSLRTTYTATTALVRDRLATELTNLESELAIELGRPSARTDEPALVSAWLRNLTRSKPWLSDPFVLYVDGGAISRDFIAGWPRGNPLSPAPGLAATIREAEATEFGEGQLEAALAKYRQALGASSSDATRALVLMRIGRTLFKLRRFEEGIAGYQEVLELPPETVDSHGLPYTVNALLEISDGLAATGRTAEIRALQRRLLQFVVDHPWDADRGYGYYLSRAVESAPPEATELRTRGNELRHAAESIQWFHREIRARVEADLRGRGWTGTIPRRFVVMRDTESVVISGFPIPHASGSPRAFFGYAIRPERVAGPLLAEVLKTVDLGGQLRIEVLDEHGSGSARADAADGPTALALADLSSVLPGWSVGLFHRDGQSIDQLARRERWLYGTPIVAMIAVLILGVAQTLRASAREVELSRLKTEFVSNVSHELKTPLALIRMFGETLESGIVTDEAKRQEFYAIIRRESDRLTHLINNVLDVARIDAGTKQYAMTEADVVALVREAIGAYQPLFDRLGFEIDATLPDSPVLVSMDRDAIAQALVNLFQNAIKYSGDVKKLGVAVAVEGGTVRLSVADQGIGIASAEIPHIFEKHYRIRSETPSAPAGSGGSGLGLSIVKHAIEAHGGQVEVASAPDRGSRFTLVLPIRATT